MSGLGATPAFRRCDGHFFSGTIGQAAALRLWTLIGAAHPPFPSFARLLSVLPLVFIIASCASDPSSPDITTSVKTVTVNVPVPVPCIAVADIPIVPSRTPITAAAGPEQKAAAVDADLKAYVRYAGLADPLMQQCSKGVTSP